MNSTIPTSLQLSKLSYASSDMVVVDLDTGTILGTNVVLCDPFCLRDGMADSEVIAAATKNGQPLYFVDVIER